MYNGFVLVQAFSTGEKALLHSTAITTSLLFIILVLKKPEEVVFVKRIWFIFFSYFNLMPYNFIGCSKLTFMWYVVSISP